MLREKEEHGWLSTVRAAVDTMVMLKTPFLGRYSDPGHPEGWRVLERGPDNEPLTVVIRGVDEAGGAEWQIKGSLAPLLPSAVSADFGPMGGAAGAVIGVLQTDGSLVWPDGSSWTRLLRCAPQCALTGAQAVPAASLWS